MIIGRPSLAGSRGDDKSDIAEAQGSGPQTLSARCYRFPFGTLKDVDG
jgi:hypothetical protein